MSGKTYKIIVAKYKEDISWVQHMDKSNIIIYNKGEIHPSKLFETIPVINIPNLGRESETYIRYIVENYNNLPDYVFFIQGRPFDHCDSKIANKSNFQLAINNILKNPPIHTVGLFSNIHSEKHYRYIGIRTIEYMNLIFNIDENPSKIHTFYAGCQYLVPKQDILSKPVEFYKRLHIMLINKKANLTKHQNVHEVYSPENYIPMGLNAWTFERLGPLIFNHYDSDKLPKYMKAEIHLVCSIDKQKDSIPTQKNICEKLLEQGFTVVYINSFYNEKDFYIKYGSFKTDYSKQFYYIQENLNDVNTYQHICFIDHISIISTEGNEQPEQLVKFINSKPQPIPSKVIN